MLNNLTSLAKSSSCPKCARKWTKERFQQAISESFEGSEYEVVGPYLGSNVPTEVKHASCGNIWFVTPNNFLNGGTRCPACSTPRNSKLSRTVHKALIEALGGLELRREYVFQGDGAPVSVGGRSLSFDFWIPGLKLLIEADGLLHDSPWNDAHGRSKLEAQQANDRIKDEWAERVGYTLFRIPHHHPNWKTAVQEAVRLARDRQTSSE
jgi:predicted Zn-ribbon and HTH transcriptional regulator